MVNLAISSSRKMSLPTLIDKRAYVREHQQRHRKKDFDLSVLLQEVQEEPTVATILFTDVPLEDLGTITSKKIHR